MKKLVLLLFLVLFPFLSMAAEQRLEEPIVFFNTPTFTYHYDRSQTWNEKNFGVGITSYFTRHVSIGLGQFRNSNFKTARYAFVSYEDDIYRNLGVGVAGGPVTNYPFKVAALPFIRLGSIDDPVHLKVVVSNQMISPSIFIKF